MALARSTLRAHSAPTSFSSIIGLPDFKGDNVARQLKWEPGLDKIRFIAITGLPTSDVRQRALDAGCEEVYAKPLDPALLEELLAKS